MPRRSYRQYCAVARALDVLGDRWTLLILRNLLLGPQTWSELRDGLPGVAKNLLSERLKQLIEDGLLEHDGAAYRLTNRGAEVEPVLFALAEWAERHVMGPARRGEAFRLRYLMTSIRRRLGATSRTMTLQLFVDGTAFWARLGGAPTVRQGLGAADATVRWTRAEFLSLLKGSTPAQGASEEFRRALRPGRRAPSGTRQGQRPRDESAD